MLWCSTLLQLFSFRLCFTIRFNNGIRPVVALRATPSGSHRSASEAVRRGMTSERFPFHSLRVSLILFDTSNHKNFYFRSRKGPKLPPNSEYNGMRFGLTFAPNMWALMALRWLWFQWFQWRAVEPEALQKMVFDVRFQVKSLKPLKPSKLNQPFLLLQQKECIFL